LQAGQPYDEAGYADCLKSSVAGIVAEQKAAGIDIPSDGEFGKSISWSQYALERLSGFEKREMPADENTFAQGADRERFAEFYEELDGKQKFATINQASPKGSCPLPPLQVLSPIGSMNFTRLRTTAWKPSAMP
jgi:5-methyltetrahydropteroyltriglutamate--homocysteine methyltransferase